MIKSSPVPELEMLRCCVMRRKNKVMCNCFPFKEGEKHYKLFQINLNIEDRCYILTSVSFKSSMFLLNDVS